jgi:hypothetical protein
MTQTKQRMCASKRRHGTRQAAEDQMWALIRGGAAAGGMNVYKCPYCRGGWHVGHKPGNGRSR